MNIKDAKPGMHVRYVPNHAHGDIRHPDCENGVVTGVNEHVVFVKYNPRHDYGVATDADDLVAMP
jgi:hypothetical protein